MKIRFALPLVALVLGACINIDLSPTAPAPDGKTVATDTAANPASQATLQVYVNEWNNLPLTGPGNGSYVIGFGSCAPMGIVPVIDFVSSAPDIVAITFQGAPRIDAGTACALGQVGWVQQIEFITLRYGSAVITRTLRANPHQSKGFTINVIFDPRG